MGKERVVSRYNRILFSLGNEENPAICDNTLVYGFHSM
jgi:hypothetical protein